MLAVFPMLVQACHETEIENKVEDTKLVITASFVDQSAIVGKTSWVKEDRINFLSLKGGDALKEVASPATISDDGSKASFEFASLFPKDADSYCAYVVGEGADAFAGNSGVHVPSVSSNPSSAFPVLIGKTTSSSKNLSFERIYSHISFTTEQTGISYVILEGKNSEIISRANIVSFSDFSVSADPENPQEGASIRTEVYGAGTYFIPLFPGIVFENGYKLTAYGTSGKVEFVAETEDRLEIGRGQVINAPEFQEAGSQSGFFDAAKVVCSFGVLSDTHINGSNGQNCEDKLRNAFAQLKSQAAKDDADGLDGVLIAGDLIDYGAYLDSQLSTFKSIYEAAFNPEQTPLVYTIGNHDPNTSYWWNSAVYQFAKSMRSKFGSKYETTDIETTMRDKFECRHCVVNGYHVLAVTPNSVIPVAYPQEVITWLDNTLKTITESDPERYVILITHPMIYNTVYGSLLGPGWLYGSCQDQWSTAALTPTLENYPQVMTFSGHLHFPINDPRSIWQGAFTSFGCGSTRYMAIEDGRYENMSSTTVMKDAADVSSGLLLQFDESGNARVTKMFFSQNTTFDYPWELKHPTSDKSHLVTYNHTERKAQNTAPTLSSLDVSLVDAGTSQKTVYAKFAAGEDDEFVHHYVLTIRKGSADIITKRILADFYKHQWFDDMTGSYTQLMGNLESGNYTLVLQAYDSWDACAELTKDFTVNAGAVTPSAPASLYADIDFTSGSITDSKGMLNITNNGATAGKVSVTHKGKSANVDALTTGSGKYATCVFKNLTSAGAFTEFASKSFSVEAFFVDKKNDGKIHGIVCGTEYGGWGLATRATGVPYFIVGDAKYNTYVSADAKAVASGSELTHLVGVYDYSKKAIKIYVNGTLNAQASISGPFYPGDKTAFNAFCLGADVCTTAADPHYPSVDMVIADAKIYSGAMSDSEVSAAYSAAVATLK